MTKVAISAEHSMDGETLYRAVAGQRQAVAKTVGAALDALTAQLPAEEGGTLVVIQNNQPDRFFTVTQQQRLEALMERWRGARDTGKSLTPAEEAELRELVDAEVHASGQRAAAASNDLEK